MVVITESMTDIPRCNDTTDSPVPLPESGLTNLVSYVTVQEHCQLISQCGNHGGPVEDVPRIGIGLTGSR